MKEDPYKGMLAICEYFKSNIENNSLFQSEFALAEKINSNIAQTDQLSKVDVVELLQTCNGINNIEHYNGSAWLDYKMHLVHLLKLNGFEVAATNNELILINP